MPKTSKQMVEEFKSFIPFVEGLNIIEESIWNKALSEGNWSLKDVISHIMLWDKYFYEEGIEKIKLKQQVTVRHLNFDEFNAKAREYAKNQTKESIIEQFVDYRTRIINDITELQEDEYTKEYKDGDGNKFTIHGYLRGFIPHDKHHKKQIEKVIHDCK
ncbi:DinB family protein [Caldalkalibacillus mannanilyticus]|uniref:DinB family protein n=1 Tax=Caldalkalibacillus mannanilyticus TaxID=1418 RepID=UPI00046994A9|nr:DinB family protein [Caldalkalibacillus mannanilyticus]